MLSKKEIQEGLAQCHCSENYWKNDALCFQYTDGIKFLHESCEAYWLLIAISGYSRKEPFQLWQLKVKENCSAVLTMREDTGQPTKVRQEIVYTDFPLQEISIYLIDGILLLPSEY